MSKLRIRDLSLTFVAKDGTDLKVIDNLSFDAEEGEFLSILGPSGCGKSTVLNIVAGLARPNAGSVEMDGNRLAFGGEKLPSAIGYVFQDARLLNWMTVEDNLELILEAAGVPQGEWDSRISHYLAMVGLSAVRSRFPLELSGGMAQRVSLVRALMINPRVILMDEPLGSLDAITARKLRYDLLRLWEETRPTVLYVTHNISEAVFLSDRILLLLPRPASIYREVPIRIPRPRKPLDPELLALEQTVTEDFFRNVIDKELGNETDIAQSRSND